MDGQHPRANPGAAWRQQPALAADRCFTPPATRSPPGRTCGTASWTTGRPAPARSAFPLYGTSRTVAGGPIEGGVYACALQTVDRAIARGLYGSWRPSAAERARLEQIFPTGVCDYTRPDVGRP